MKTSIDFDFHIAESVKIIAIGMIGKIDSLSFDNNGPMYRVIYWNDGSRHQVWMYSWEIESIENITNKERSKDERN